MIREHEEQHWGELHKKLVQLQSLTWTTLESFRLTKEERTPQYEKLIHWVAMSLQALQKEFYYQIHRLKEE